MSERQTLFRSPALAGFAGWVLVATLLCGGALLRLAMAAVSDALHSYTVAIPFISAWLLWPHRRDLSGQPGGGSKAWALGFGVAALVAAGFGLKEGVGGWVAPAGSLLTWQALTWVLAVWAGAAWFFGPPVLRAHAFAWMFLVFTVPLPPVAVDAIEVWLQNTSADAVELAYRIGRVTYSRDDRAFWLPGLRFIVAQECSGIRSTLVLLITSLLGGQLLLRSRWRKAIFVAFVVPLGIARNAFRICVLTLLTVHVDPRIIDSPLHHKGGPLFFLVSLIPLFLLLGWFRRQEQRVRANVSGPPDRGEKWAEETLPAERSR